MRKTTGFTMIEVLVAMIIISVGLLGVAGLFAESQKNIQEVQQRSTALLLAEDILARMSANQDGLNNYNGTITAPSAKPNVLCDQDSSNCSPANTAAFDLWEWSSALHGADIQNQAASNVGGLLLPITCIAVNPNPGPNDPNVILTIAWRGKFARPDGNSGNNCGDGDTNYASGGVNNVLRRLMIINTTIS